MTSNGCMTSGLTDKQLSFIRDLVYRHSRINLDERKVDLVHSRLRKRLRDLRLDDYQDYCDLLKSPRGGEEIQNLVDAISTNHTFFFREEKHFTFLRDRAVPELSRKGAASEGQFRVWSAACSSGEEPYSIAILLNEHPLIRGGRGWDLTATDISTKILRCAEEGVYQIEKIRNMPDEWFRRYFLVGRGRTEGQCRIRPELQKSIRFQRINLFQPEYDLGPPFQIIFCRNVMIYFDRESQEHLVSRLYECLVPGGYLMVGHSESLLGLSHGFQMIQAAVYQRPNNNCE